MRTMELDNLRKENPCHDFIVEARAWALLFAEKHRLLVTRCVAFSILMLIAVSAHSWERSAFADVLMEMSGLFLISLCTFGRLWASMHIAGRKEHSLVTEGPYAIVRHPLYFFSFLGAVGIGLSSENVLALGLIVILFCGYYPFVILAEEKRLMEIHKERYVEYAKRTPRFIPRSFMPREPDQITINVKHFRRNFYRVMWFFWFFMILQIIERLHHMGLLPVFLRIP